MLEIEFAIPHKKNLLVVKLRAVSAFKTEYVMQF